MKNIYIMHHIFFIQQKDVEEITNDESPEVLDNVIDAVSKKSESFKSSSTLKKRKLNTKKGQFKYKLEIIVFIQYGNNLLEFEVS